MESVPETTELALQLQAALGDAYVVGRPLGAGGFAVVFHVRDVQLKRDLAVKVLSPDVVTSRSVVERFRREAETVAQLSHPHIVPLHFVGQGADLVYIAMQCVDGGSLADRLELDGQLPIADAVRYMTEIAAALGHAHRHGVVHRDVKPQNVLLEAETGRCLVTDFGIARTPDSVSLTATGMVLGTPAYLAPEQVTGEPSDHRVDIYALGVIAFEMLAGRPPFEGPNPTAVLMKRLGDPPPRLTTIRADVPDAIADVVATCLMPDPETRFQSATDISRALTGHTPTTGTRSMPQRPNAARSNALGRRAWLVAGVAAVVIAIAVATLLSRKAAVKPSPRLPIVASVDSGMASIPSADYLIGSDEAGSAAFPLHTVHLDAFGLGKHEVTVEEYKRFVDATSAPAPWVGAMPDGAYPVTRVLWAEAASYCRWAHRDGGRLPSEEEWEAAARGTRGRLYPWGEQPDAQAANIQSGGRNAPTRVGSFPRGATPEGVLDLLGNVWEWTSSPMQAYTGARALPISMRQFRVIRGGAFNSADAIATPWYRGYGRPSTRPKDLEFTGFRCAMPARATRASCPEC